MASGADENVGFGKLLKAFEKDYHVRRPLIEYHMKKILELLPDALLENEVRFQQPLTSRTKTLKSAEGSIERRRRARMERLGLKTSLEEMGKNWEDYWTRRDKPERIHDFGPFPEDQPLINALHDIGGIRVLVYFPGHVSKVIDTLKGLEKQRKLKVHRVVKRGNVMGPDMYKLKSYVNELLEIHDPEQQNENRIFAGYRATHAHVSLEGEHEEVIVEIQVVTVVMNAWTQVEHDIIYKTEENKTQSKEEIGILETFNGIVMVGEEALKQLETIQRSRKEQAELHNDTIAESIYDVGKWIETH
ncbi:hypothetical protein ACHAQA_009529 [Verticillium albo-atrum]